MMDLMGLSSLTGLSKLKRLAVRDIRASRFSGETFPNTGLFGPGGLGKTAFANAIADDLGYHFVTIEGSAFRSRESLIQVLTRCNAESIKLNTKLCLFIDEVHRLGTLQEVLYYPLDNHRITVESGEIIFRPFTLIVATTHPNLLLRSFLRRLKNRWVLGRYKKEDLRLIIASWLSKKGLDFDINSVDLIASRSLGSPSQALDSLCSKIRNQVLSNRGSRVTGEICELTFALEGIDSFGLGQVHRDYLMELGRSMRPKGIGALSGALGEDEEVIRSVIEPDLLYLRLIDFSSRGRILTDQGKKYISGVL